MPYVERAPGGGLQGVYVQLQPGYAEEWLEAEDAEVVAFMAPKQPVPEAISDRQFFHGLALRGEVTEAEALAAVRTGAVPAAFQTFIDALPAEERFGATMLVSGAIEFRRSHLLTVAFSQAKGWTSEATDEFWRYCASL